MPGRVFHHIAFRVQHGPPDEERTLSEHRSHPGVSCTNKRHCTIIVAPRNWEFIENMTILSVAGRDGPHHGPESSITAIVEDNHKVIEIQSQTRQHLRDQRSSTQWREISRVMWQAQQCEAVDEEASSRMLDSQFSDRVVEVFADVQFVQCLRATEISRVHR